jgi:flagellar export protein FliJ
MPQPFRLGTVWELRKRREEQRQAELAQAEAQAAQTRAALQARETARVAIVTTLDAMKTAPHLDSYALQATMHHHARAILAVEEARAQAQTATWQVASARQISITASQERLMVERLRDTFAQEQRAAAAHTEAAQLGELGLIRWQTQQLKS